MTIKNFIMEPNLGYAQISETYGGQQIQIIASHELQEIIEWWKNME
jgi:hypothetical protein